jgi:hypothetical protein
MVFHPDVIQELIAREDKLGNHLTLEKLKKLARSNVS